MKGRVGSWKRSSCPVLQARDVGEGWGKENEERLKVAGHSIAG